MPGCRIPAADVLRSVVTLLDRAVERESAAPPQAAVLVRLDRLPQSEHDELQFSLRKLAPGVHPLAALDGFVAPPTWAGIGVVCAGRARDLDDPSVIRGRARLIMVVTRDGFLGSALRVGGGELLVEVEQVGSTVTGAIPLALCRALGLPVRHGVPSGEPE